MLPAPGAVCARGAQLAACLLVLLAAGSALADDTQLPRLLYPTPPALRSLVGPLPGDLPQRIEHARARLTSETDPTAQALTTFAVERLVHLHETRDTPEPLPAPDHATSLALLEALDLDALEGQQRAEALAALGLARAASDARETRARAIEPLREALAAWPADDATRRTALALVLAERLVDSGESAQALEFLAQVDDVQADDVYDALVTWRRAELATARKSAPTAEKLLFALLNELAERDARIDRLDPALLDRIVVGLAEAGAGREEGWVRTALAAERLREADLTRVYPQLVTTYDAGGLPMNRARVRLFGATRELVARDALAAELEVVVAVAEGVRGPAATQLCLEALEVGQARLATPETTLAPLVTRCLELYLDAPRDPQRPELVLALYDPLLPRFAALLRPLDRARYGMALLDSGQTGFAREHLMAVDIDQLPESERLEFARAALELRYVTNKDIQLAALSCTLRRAQALPVEDVRYEGWLETALGAARDAEERYRLLEMRLAVRLMNGRYEEGLERVTALLDAADAAILAPAKLEAMAGQVIGCLDRAGRWHELTLLTPLLRRRLPAEARDAVFERFGTTLTAAHLDLANALDLAGRTEEAVTLLLDMQRTWRTNPDGPELLFATGALLAATGEAHRAMTYYEQIFEEFPTHPLADDALFAAALAVRESGDLHTARLLLERITTRHSTGEFPQRALEILEQLEPATTTAP